MSSEKLSKNAKTPVIDTTGLRLETEGQNGRKEVNAIQRTENSCFGVYIRGVVHRKAHISVNIGITHGKHYSYLKVALRA